MQLIYVNPLSSAVTATPADTPCPFTESCMRAVKILLRFHLVAQLLQLTSSHHGFAKELFLCFSKHGCSVASLRYSIFKR